MYFIFRLKKSLRKTALLLLLQTVAITSFCQDNLNTLTASFNRYFKHTSIEQLFVHTDKNFYLAGEILWFKVYAVDITLHKPIDLSKVAYAEILDTNNTPVLQAKIAMEGGNGNGSVYLPLTLHSGNYKLRAYTNWMKNAGADCFFEKIITIVNVQKVAERPQQETAVAYDVQFFPEGGNLVAGLENKIAFKVMDNSGKGVPARGAIIDNGDTIAQFATGHVGMGYFKLTPVSNHTYTAIVRTNDGRTVSKTLPTAYSTGTVMQVYNAGDKVKVHVQSNSSNAGAVYLLVHTGAAIQVAEQSTLQNGSTVFTFNQSALRAGIAHLTLFNADRQPLCERAYFKRPDTTLNIRLLASQNEYATRSKVNITVSSPNLKTNDTANLSMAVYRLDSIQSIDENTIAAYLLLTSGLKGYIEDASYYFTKQNKQADEDLDNLLLINGWSRFKWEDVLKNNKPMFTYVPEYNGHVITGKVTNRITGKPQQEIETYLSVPGLKTQFVPAVSDTNGMVRFEMENFYGSSEVIAQAKEQGENYKIQIDNPFSTTYTATAIPIFHLPEAYPNTLLEQSINMQVRNIYAANQLNQFYLPAIDTTPFYTTPDSKYNLDNYTRFSTMEEVLREYVAMVNVTKRSGKYHLQVFDKGHDVPFTNDPLVLFDGVPIVNLNTLLEVDPLKVKSLEVVQKKYFLGASSFDGILNWKTYNGDLASYELNPAAVVVDYEALQLKREFYAPVYNDNTLLHKPDFRNVLYWNPDVRLQGSKEEVYSFYTSDLPGRYAIVVQGVSASGLCGSTINTLEVNK
ncbi:hypothetical protein FC093_15505 [Ilyomonas limi]|uniref:Macroglobulin domain-containing protein n=1 Tax=Ilyomonas limi TaxID=2575867 RepID=A0A4U3L0B6_9BACT|nr:hypothetical protein [Ilyomonas limi]TKK66906.1 hypothetical protein FC093_15505 [Ilyomonas limi]